MRTHSPMPSERRRLLCIYARALLASCLLLYSAMAIGHLGSTLSSPLSPWSRLRGSGAAGSDPPPLDGYERRAQDATIRAQKSCRTGTAGEEEGKAGGRKYRRRCRPCRRVVALHPVRRREDGSAGQARSRSARLRRLAGELGRLAGGPCPRRWPALQLCSSTPREPTGRRAEKIPDAGARWNRRRPDPIQNLTVHMPSMPSPPDRTVDGWSGDVARSAAHLLEAGFLYRDSLMH